MFGLYHADYEMAEAGPSCLARRPPLALPPPALRPHGTHGIVAQSIFAQPFSCLQHGHGPVWPAYTCNLYPCVDRRLRHSEPHGDHAEAGGVCGFSPVPVCLPGALPRGSHQICHSRVLFWPMANSFSGPKCVRIHDRHAQIERHMETLLTPDSQGPESNQPILLLGWVLHLDNAHAHGPEANARNNPATLADRRPHNRLLYTTDPVHSTQLSNVHCLGKIEQELLVEPYHWRGLCCIWGAAPPSQERPGQGARGSKQHTASLSFHQ
ncbi:hypothetical protein B0I35DRAFT_14676 [Stachybotrys elegans]|uniref:Uncharacterized protein n=1 Tax=Stachybotrys elegans TaxID=80388 RepID=A0A8K0WXX8_9HYPO|nr:hypothetical protein B0I35DRAFT_14676 [Stachybotrys elegans]